MRRPPALSKWLLERVVSHDSIAGDLAEEYASGRSTLWYVMQVLSAIVIGTSGDIRKHKWLSVRAIVVGWAFLVWWVSIFNLLSWKEWTDDQSGCLWWGIPIAGFFASGWVVGRFHRTPMVFTFLGCIVFGSALRYLGLTPNWLPGTLQPEGMLALLAPLAILGGVLFSFRSNRSRDFPLQISRSRG